MSELTVTETMSPTIGKLVNALCKAQAAMKPAVKDTSNPFFKSKYADLSAVWEAIRSPLTDHGLAVIQAPAESNGDVVILDTLLAHESGEWIKSRLCMRPAKSDPQGIGSCLTYARRYALGAIAGVATEEDDDGNAASKPNGVKQTPLRDKVIEKAKPVEEAGPVLASVPTSEPPQALPPPTDSQETHFDSGILKAVTKADKLTKANKPWGTVTLEKMNGQEVVANWFGFSNDLTFEQVQTMLGEQIDFSLKPATNPKYKPTLEHFFPVLAEGPST